MTEGSASTIIDRSPADVFAALADVTRMGEWSPENTGGRWLDDATGPAAGVRFEGDNIVKLGPVTLKRWTTTSEITECVPAEVFEFVTEQHTTWRYELAPEGAGTKVTESYSHPPYQGMQKLVYGMLAQRQTAMVKGMERTLARAKIVLEKPSG